jgi:nitrite reductase (NADH) small subunit/3-phenylpropionate/trans-cinnamate dioxygenase ferredoxin subunit
MANFVKVCKTADVKAGCGRSIEINGKPVALFNVDGGFYAINDVCGHRGGPLGEGELDGKTVICPGTAGATIVTTSENEVVPDLPQRKNTGERSRARTILVDLK